VHPARGAGTHTVRVPRACLTCGTPTTTTRCLTCQRLHRGGTYARRSRQVRASATVCWLCGRGPDPNDGWEADHVDPTNPLSELRAAHRSCNLARRTR